MTKSAWSLRVSDSKWALNIRLMRVPWSARSQVYASHAKRFSAHAGAPHQKDALERLEHWLHWRKWASDPKNQSSVQELIDSYAEGMRLMGCFKALLDSGWYLQQGDLNRGFDIDDTLERLACESLTERLELKAQQATHLHVTWLGLINARVSTKMYLGWLGDAMDAFWTKPALSWMNGLADVALKQEEFIDECNTQEDGVRLCETLFSIATRCMKLAQPTLADTIGDEHSGDVLVRSDWMWEIWAVAIRSPLPKLPPDEDTLAWLKHKWGKSSYLGMSSPGPHDGEMLKALTLSASDSQRDWGNLAALKLEVSLKHYFSGEHSELRAQLVQQLKSAMESKRIKWECEKAPISTTSLSKSL